MRRGGCRLPVILWSGGRQEQSVKGPQEQQRHGCDVEKLQVLREGWIIWFVV